MTPPSFAIVGSGPSGCYLAQSLRRSWPESEITVFDRLATPYGLIRYGIAPDHQSTKAITRQFDRLFTDQGVRFAGNMTIGQDLSLSELREAYDVVILATGLTRDRALGIQGEQREGVYGAGAVTRCLNSYPFESSEPVNLGERTAIIGNGNVAIDIVRFLIKREEDYAGSDVCDQLLEAYCQRPVSAIDLIGRSPLPEAKFDPQMIRELVKIPGVAFRVAVPLPETGPLDRQQAAKVAAVRELIEHSSNDEPRVVVTFRFDTTPVAITGRDRVDGIDLLASTPTGETSTETLAVDSVITAIGFQDWQNSFLADATVQALSADPETGKIAGNLYAVGWFKRGPVGTVPQNRSDAKRVAEAITAEQRQRSEASPDASSCRPGVSALPEGVLARSVGFEGWQRIDAYEVQAAAPNRCRKKISDQHELVAVALAESRPESQGVSE